MLVPAAARTRLPACRGSEGSTSVLVQQQRLLGSMDPHDEEEEIVSSRCGSVVVSLHCSLVIL